MGRKRAVSWRARSIGARSPRLDPRGVFGRRGRRAHLRRRGPNCLSAIRSSSQTPASYRGRVATIRVRKAWMSERTKTLRDAAIDVLRDRRPMHYRGLTDEIRKRNVVNRAFVRVRPGVFGLRGHHPTPTPPSLSKGKTNDGAAAFPQRDEPGYSDPRRASRSLRKRTLEVLPADPHAFADLETEA